MGIFIDKTQHALFISIPSDKYLSIHIKAALTKFQSLYKLYRFNTANYIIYYFICFCFSFIGVGYRDIGKLFTPNFIYVTHEGFRSIPHIPRNVKFHLDLHSINRLNANEL